MRRTVKNICCLLLMLVVAVSLCVPVFAQGSVSYQGHAEGFVFAPGSEYSPTDLFSDFKEVMPGDSITQQIVVKNDAAQGIKIKLYLRALGAQAGSEEFLSQMQLTVRQQGQSELFHAPADQTAQLTDWVCLGTFYAGADVTLDVSLNVPVSMGNDYQAAIGYLDWQFKAEELPMEPGDPQVPNTGDNARPAWYFGLMTLSLVVVLFLLLGRKKQNKEQA